MPAGRLTRRVGPIRNQGAWPEATGGVKTLYNLYDSGEAAQQAVDDLRAAGLDDNEITVITSRPMIEHEFSDIGQDTWIWYIACGGGLSGLFFAAWLTRFAETSWPLVTGNMPIVAWWPNLIVIFELTMLGVILATVATLVAGVGLLRRRPPLYDPEVAVGKSWLVSSAVGSAARSPGGRSAGS